MRLRTGIVLPESYKDFLLQFNGGAPSPDMLEVPNWYGGATCLAYFFGLYEGDTYNLEKTYRGAAEYLPDGFLPIAEDSGGNLICLGIKSRKKNKVYFWDHEDMLDSEGKPKRDFSNMYLLANSFEKFLDEKILPGD